LKPGARKRSGQTAEPGELLQTVPLPVCALDLDGRVICWNRAAAATFGYSSAEVLGEEPPGLDGPGRAALAGALARAREAQPVPQSEVTLTRADGTAAQVLAVGAGLTGAGQEPAGLILALLEITEAGGPLAEELRRRNRFIETILDNLPIGLAVNALDMSKVGYVNARFQEIYGSWGEADAGGGTFFERIVPDARERQRIRRQLVQDSGGDPPERLQWDNIRVTGRDGTSRIVTATNIPLPDQGLMISTVQDVTDRKLAEEALRESERRYQIMAESSPVGIFRTDLNGRCRYVNRRWREIAGMTADRAASEGWLVAVHPDDREQVTSTWRFSVEERRTFRVECRFKRPGGLTTWVFVQAEPVFDSYDELTGYIGSVTDISDRKRNEEEIRQLAYYDALTRLPNRAFFLEQLQRALGSARRTGARVALLFCDLDNFKDVNDTLGHDTGDLLLKGIAERLSSCIRKGDTLSRLGGDEFVLLLPAVAGDREAASVARKIKRTMARPFDLDGNEVFTATSIGIALFPDDGRDTQTLMKHADMAMYAAKSRGRNRYQFFSEDMNRRMQDRMQLESGLRQALELGQFSLVYQPQYELATGKLIGTEALLRWNHPERGRIPPSRFIPLAEETGLIHPIGEWVLRTACEQAREWQELGFADLRVAVNISGRQFVEEGLVDLVRRVLADTGVAPHLLELEITENVLMQDTDVAIATLEALRADGVKLTIDSFGTGYASLLYLKQLPVDRVKISRVFVRDIATNRADAAIAEAVINLARSLDLVAVAEGVESEAQAQVLRRLGCPQVQGFHFDRPLDSADFARRLH